MKSPNCFWKTLAIIMSIIVSAFVTFAVCTKLFDKKYIAVSE